MRLRIGLAWLPGGLNNQTVGGAEPVQTPAVHDQILKQRKEKFNFYSVLMCTQGSLYLLRKGF